MLSARTLHDRRDGADRTGHARAFVAAAFTLAVCGCGSEPTGTPQQPDADSARAAWIAMHTIPVPSVDPANRDWTDLEPLRSLIGDARVVLLGEASHGDGAAFLAKSRLIIFLHEEMDFDVLAFESGLFPVSKAWEELRAGRTARDALGTAIYPVWMGSEQVRPLFEYIEARASSPRPLELVGTDAQLYGSATADHLVSDLEKVLARGGSPLVATTEWPTFRNLLQDAVTSVWWDDKPSLTEKAAFDAIYDDVMTTIETGLPGVPAHETAFWRQVLRSTRVYVEITIAVDPDIGLQKPQRIARDMQMGENLVWLAGTLHPQKKIIVWAHNYHIFRNVREVEGTGNPAAFEGLTTMGDVVRSAFGDHAFVLGFTAHGGEWGYWYPDYDPTPLTSPPAGSLEDLFHRAGIARGILDLRNTAGDGAWLSDRTVARPLDYFDALARWPDVMDAVFFTDRMSRSTSSGWFSIDAARRGAGTAPY